ncbi:hypothetical protein HC928_11040 [bacterium]|nr:hypothetical protein [bacterium]
MKLVILITAQTEQSLQVATAWQQAGASGVTILEGHGLHRLQKKFEIRSDLPLIPSLESLLRGKEIDTHVLVSVVDDDLATRLKAETVVILGDLTLPGNGILLSLDVGDILGLRID